jgi:hypothetical protein
MFRFLTVLGVAMCCGSAVAHAATQTTISADTLIFYDAFTASVTAAVKCDPATTPDLTNYLMASQNAAGALHAQNPGKSPAEIMDALRARGDGVRKTVQTAITSSGCDSEQIKQLRKNFTVLSAANSSAHAGAATGQAVPPNSSPIPGDAIFIFGKTRYFRALVDAIHCDQFDNAKFTQLNQRFERARLAFSQRFGAKFFMDDKPAGLPAQGRSCDSGALAGYENHISEMEQLLSK